MSGNSSSSLEGWVNQLFSRGWMEYLKQGYCFNLISEHGAYLFFKFLTLF